MKTIESLLTHQNPAIRQLIAALLELGYKDIEVEIIEGHYRLYQFIIATFQFRCCNYARPHEVYWRNIDPVWYKIDPLIGGRFAPLDGPGITKFLLNLKPKTKND